jgi:1-acyl-sn-glycerol-3-phosphate acyltransferase
MLLWARSLIFTTLMMLSAAVVGGLAPLTFPLPFKTRSRILGQWARSVAWLLRVIVRLDYRIEGAENIPRDGAAILLSKHQSAWETIVFQCIFPPQTWVLKRSLLWIPFFGWGLALLRSIGIDRAAGKAALKQVVKEGTQRLNEGVWIVLFPEGTRMLPGVKGKYAIGGAMLAAQSKFPVVPVAHNAGCFWPRRGWLKYPGTVIVRVGPILDSATLSAGEIQRQAEDWIEAQMPDLLESCPVLAAKK